MENTSSSLTEKKKAASDMYCQALANLGYTYSVDADGDLDFKVKNADLEFTVLIDEGHVQFIRICCVAFYIVSSNDDKSKIYRACNAANLTAKVAKTYVLNGEKSVSVAYESIVPTLTVPEIEHAVRTAVVVNAVAIKQFIKYMQKSA